MDQIKVLLESFQTRLSQWLGTTPATLQFTGLLGLVILGITFFQLRADRQQQNHGQNAARNQPQQQQTAQATTSQRQPAAPPNSSAISSRTAAAQTAKLGQTSKTTASYVPDTAVGRAVCTSLAGVRRVTMSLPGTLFQESSTSDLQEAATVVPQHIEIVKEMCKAAEVILICQVLDDIGQAVATGAVEAAGLLGNSAGQIKPHKLLFCSTLEGKVSVVRQLEPELHIDGHPNTVDDLKRFIPQLVHISKSSSSTPAPNVGQFPTLAAFFGL